jgi:redox-sensitive bicupin YhaK (pirin superfamily)
MSRSVAHTIKAVSTVEGEGFPVRRPFPTSAVDHLDPFLLLDHMGPKDNAPGEAKGAPDHPHRGFETVTYMLNGEFEHEDSVGNRGMIETGGVQWMTAGSGVVHSEMPSRRIREQGGVVEGVQLWVNLPAADKMIPPRYQEVGHADIPEVEIPGGTARIISGSAFGTDGAASTHSPITYVHVTLEPAATATFPAPRSQTALVYHLNGDAEGTLDVYASDDDEIEVSGGDTGADLLVLVAEPLNEPVARSGPFVMNTEDEIVQAFDDFRSGRMGAIAR